MEKRSSQRLLVKIPFVCSHLSSFYSIEPAHGIILNICEDGFYAELEAHVKVGTILMFRMTGSPSECHIDDGLRSMGLAEVRWSKVKLVGGEVQSAIGLSYLKTL